MIDPSGRQLLLIHGWGFGAAVWQPLIDQLPNDCPVNAVSLPGYAADADDTVMDMPAVIETLAAELLPATVIVGWSLGGLLALELARRRPDRVRALGLIASLPCFTRRAGWAAGWQPDAIAAVRSRLREDAAAACRYVAALAARGDRESYGVKAALLSCAVPAHHVLARDLDYLMSVDCRAVFAGLRLPMHAWLGDRDALIGGDSAAAMQALQPAANIHELSRAGHAPLLSRPRELARDLELLL